MIDFRYHIVSIIAVFLALGVGILLGSSVLSTGTVSVLEGQQRALRSQLDGARRDITDLRRERDQQRTIVEQASPWVVQDLLSGLRVVTVTDGGSARWREGVRDGLVEAGAQPVGALELTDKLKLNVEGQADELALLVRSTLGAFEPGQKPAEAALTLLGQRLFDPEGQALLRKLMDAKFVAADGADLRGTWPPRGTLVAAFASPYPKSAPQPGWLAAFARGAATATATLVVSGLPSENSAVTTLRALDDLPPTLATFDSGSAPSAEAAGAITLSSAVRGRGGHFGTEPGRRFIPEPS